MKPYSLSVIIPVYNEVRTIASVIEIVRSWGKAKEIIVVNDGSKDQTLQAISQFTDTVMIISYSKNRGKGYALFRGIQKSTGDILMFLDGDIVGLTHRDLDSLLTPLVQKKADMVLGIVCLARLASLGSVEAMNAITGERVVYRRDIEPLSGSWKDIGYGVEVMMNEAYKHKKNISVRLPHVYILDKFEKHDLPDAMASYIIEGKDMLTQIVRDQADSMKPHARHIIKLVITYLQQAIS